MRIPILPIITAVAGIIIAVLIMRACSGPAPAGTVKIDTVWKRYDTTIYVNKPVPYAVYIDGKPVQITSRDTILIPQPYLVQVDTAKLLEDYFASRLYSDTLRHKFGYVIVRDSITQNKLVKQSSWFNLNIPEVTKTEILAKRTGWIGLDVGLGNGFAEGGLQFSYMDRKQNLFHLRADYGTTGSFIFGGGVDWKIKIFK